MASNYQINNWCSNIFKYNTVISTFVILMADIPDNNTQYRLLLLLNENQESTAFYIRCELVHDKKYVI